MLDTHFHPPNWGLIPVLFKIGNFSVTSYSFFILLGLLVGIFIYYRDSKRFKKNNEKTFFIAFAALVGGIIGAKIPVWLMYSSAALLSGRTIIGGLIGGFIAVKITKKILNIKGKRGNLFAPAIALGCAIGRIGCLLQGCCFGIATGLPVGVNFGDGILRHPTQAYESLFNLGMFFYLNHKKSQNPQPGQLLQIYLVSYFIFRFFLEFIKFEPKIIWQLTIYQILAIIILAYLLREPILNYVRSYK